MKGIFDWVPWFRALSARIVEVGEKGLIDRAQSVDWKGDNPAFLQFGVEKIDPLSFLAFLSSKNNMKEPFDIFESVHHTFGIEASLPEKGMREAWVFPTANPFKALFFGQSGEPDLFWDLFRQVQPESSTVDGDIFRQSLNRKGVGVAMLTQAMCLANPHAFLPIDDYTKSLIGQFPAADVLKKKKDKLKATITLDDYRAIMRGAQDVFRGCELYEIGRFLYEYRKKQEPIPVNEKSTYFHISTSLHGDKGDDYWDDFERENAVRTSGRASIVPFGKPLPEGKQRYPLEKPKPGDVMLVRRGMTKGRGVGIVVQNDFKGVEPSAFDEHMRIHVLWINKSATELRGHAAMFAMNHVGSATKGAFPAFASAAGYAPSIRLLRDFGVPDPPHNPSPGPDPPGPLPTPNDQTEHPLNQILNPCIERALDEWRADM